MKPWARRPIRLVAVAVLVSVVMEGAPLAGAVDPLPSVRLFAADQAITVQRSGSRGVWFDPGVWVASVNGAFELRATRPDYLTPVGLTQVDADSGEVLRTLPADVMDGWFGLSRFVHISVRDDAGALVFRGAPTFCPDTWDADRVDDLGPAISRYPQYCSANPFTMGMVWGIEDHWAVNAFGTYGVFRLRVPDGRYSVSVWIGHRYTDLLAVPEQDAAVSLDLTVETVHGAAARRPQRPSAEAPRPEEGVPTVTIPSPDTEPDLGALPAWGIGVFSRKGRDYLSFGATAWNAGPSPLVVEGFRRTGEDVMDAYQYFFDSSGSAVGRAPVGTFEYDARPGHQHWHFQQFATYALLDGSRSEIVPSTKEAFCLAPTDAIDLAAPGANWQPWSVGLETACGSAGAIWVRENLDAGWGDTYFQYLPGQSFDVTDIPNGRYFIRVEVNPLGSLYERTSDNDVSLRRVRLRGRPGKRWVVVPPWHGIDTESGCYYCFFSARGSAGA